MYIRWRKKVSNEKAYEVTQVRPWSQMKWFRYLIRLPDNTPTKTALKYLNEEMKRP